MVTPLLISLAVIILSAAAEWMHWLRIRKIARLAFGPSGKPTAFGKFSPFIRITMLGLLSWGLVTLLMVDAKVHHTEITAEDIPKDKIQHLILVLDVSPSMRLVDSGRNGKISRLKRASEVVKSLFSRLSQDYLHLTIIATYSGAMPVVIDTRDLNLVDSMLNDLPMHFAFKKGKTKLFDGIGEAARIAKPWRHDSATMVLISDGETVPSTGMIQLPGSISDVLVVGVGDPQKATFINGEQSRQNSPSLQQIANRLKGSYHDANVKHIPSDTLRNLKSLSASTGKDEFSRREFALIAIGISSSLLALIPLLLYYFGSRWSIHKPRTTTSL